jgi:hypothetical protein
MLIKKKILKEMERFLIVSSSESGRSEPDRRQWR